LQQGYEHREGLPVLGRAFEMKIYRGRRLILSRFFCYETRMLGRQVRGSRADVQMAAGHIETC
jgi:hypothetical protein